MVWILFIYWIYWIFLQCLHIFAQGNFVLQDVKRLAAALDKHPPISTDHEGACKLIEAEPATHVMLSSNVEFKCKQLQLQETCGDFG